MAFSNHRHDSDMTAGTIWKQLVRFSVPMAIGLLFQQLYNTVDSIVVGNFVSSEALAAVGSTASVINTLVGFANGLSLGSSVVISQCYGAHDNKNLHTAVHTTIALTFILGIVVTMLGMVFVDPLLRLMDTPPEVFTDAHTYLTIYFAGILGLLMYNMGSSILRAVGDSRRPLYFLIISALLNIGGDLLFVICFKMGVEGVAYATIIAQFISCILVLITLTTEQSAYGLHWKEVRLDKVMFKRIFLLGLPTGLQQAITAFSNVFVQGYINFFGKSVMAGWAAYNKLDAFLNIPIQSISMFSSTFVGQNYGAGQKKRARSGVWTSLAFSISLTLAASLAIVLLRRQVISLFTSDEAVLENGAYFVALNSAPYAFCCLFNMFAGALRGTGNTRGPMIAMLGSFVAFRQCYLAVVRAVGNALPAIALGYPIGWAVCSVITYFMYRHSVLFNDRDGIPVR